MGAVAWGNRAQTCLIHCSRGSDGCRVVVPDVVVDEKVQSRTALDSKDPVPHTLLVTLAVVLCCAEGL